ncbi:hypothetical protein [Mycolicibacterium sp.]|uniref:hypothetical protein n=1 Tax=Mycolicibacterium sp. TaxID=2320850 RepID=UPI0037C5F8B8
MIDHQLLIQDITALDDADQRAIALQYLTFELLVLDSDSDAELLDRGVRGTELYRLGCRHDWPVIGMNHPVRFRTRSDRGRQLLSSA